MITLWVEGYAATGEHGTAQYLGTFAAETYDEAVLQWKEQEWSDNKWGAFRQDSDGLYSVWGCRIFDSESKARSAFG